MNTMFDALLVSWLLVAPPVQRPVLADYSLQQLQLQALNERVEAHQSALSGRCTPPGGQSGADAALALRAAALYEDSAEIIGGLLADPNLSARDRNDYNLSLSRQYEGQARMLLKAHACAADWALLVRAGRMLQRAGVAASGNDGRIAEIAVWEEALAQRRLEFPEPVAPPIPPPPPPCPVCEEPVAKVESPPWPERLVLRFEAGVAAGERRLDSDKRAGLGETGFTHRGAVLGVSLLGRAPLARRWTLLFGPTYSYWRAENLVSNSDYVRTNSHHMAARLESGIGIGRRWYDAVSVHPGVELGIQSVFHVRREAGSAPVTADALRGASFVASLGLCFGSGSVCVSGRVGRALGTGYDSPTVAATLGVDVFGVIRAFRARRGRRK